MDPKLKELSEKSTIEVETSKRRFYWHADGYKFNNVNLARWYEKENNTWVEFVDNQLDLIRRNLSTQTFDPNKDYNVEFCRHLKKTFPKVCLLFSGGYNAANIFYYFVENNISIDEVVINIGLDIEPEITDEVLLNCNPLLEKYAHLVKKTTILQYTYEQIRNHWKGDWSLFDKPWGRMPPRCQNISIGYGMKTDPEATYIKGVDNPTLVRYKDKWYAVCLDSMTGGTYEIPNLTLFWLDGNNIMSHIKDARIYREWLIENKKIKDGLQFFYMKDMLKGKHKTHGYREIANPEAKLKKDVKRTIRKHRMIDKEKFTEMAYYCNALAKVQEILPPTDQDGPGEPADIGTTGTGKVRHVTTLQGAGKFAWFIDIDSLKIYTQQELIPHGF